MLEIIEITINKEATRSKDFAQSQFQRCFAIKSNLNPLLDVARTIYSELIEEFYGIYIFFLISDLSKTVKTDLFICIR